MARDLHGIGTSLEPCGGAAASHTLTFRFPFLTQLNALSTCFRSAVKEPGARAAASAHVFST